MRRACGLVAATLALFTPAVVLAQGCGPTRLKVMASVALAMPSAKVWAMVGSFQDLSWDRDVATARGSGGNAAEKAQRSVTLNGGMVLAESLYKYDAATMSYSYHIDKVDLAKLPIQNASVTLEVMPNEGAPETSLVRLKSAFYRNLVPGEGAPDAADAKAVKAMRDFLNSALQGLTAKDGTKTKADAKT